MLNSINFDEAGSGLGYTCRIVLINHSQLVLQGQTALLHE